MEDELEFEEGYSCDYSLTKNEVPSVTPIVEEDGSTNSGFIVSSSRKEMGLERQ